MKELNELQQIKYDLFISILNDPCFFIYDRESLIKLFDELIDSLLEESNEHN